MRRRLTPVPLVAVLILTMGGCSSSDGEDGPTEDAGASASASAAEGEAGTDSSPGTDPEVPANSPTATVAWGNEARTFVLAACAAEGPSSLEASGNDLAGGSIMTLRATDGSGQVLIQNNTTQDEEFYGEFTSFSYRSGAFTGSGTYAAADDDGDFTLRGDCKDL